MIGTEAVMNVTSTGFDVTRSIEAMGDLLKNITSSAMGLQDKLLKVSITEKVTDPALGQNFDVSA